MRAIILSIGDELILGQVADTNAEWLSAHLAEHGVMTAWRHTVPDDRAAIAAALRDAANAAELIIVTGGLGPTPDDLTREALADVLGAPLDMYPPAREKLEQYFCARGWDMPAGNLAQAMLPRGADSLENPVGTAPGIHARLGKADIYLVPGVPSEMRAMFQLHLAPRLGAQTGRVILTAQLNTFGVGESRVAELLGGLMRRDRNPLVGTTVENGIVGVRVRADFPDAAACRAELERTVQAVRQRLGAAVFGVGSDSLAEQVGALLRQRRLRLATAESCTGGLLGKMLTDVPGASDFYLGGWVVYDNSLKSGLLDVPADILRTAGAVSEVVACRMAEGAARHAGADFALAVTGIAGPGGGTHDKPVGTVWIALGERVGGKVIAGAERRLLAGDRAAVRDRAAKAALNMLRLRLLEMTTHPES